MATVQGSISCSKMLSSAGVFSTRILNFGLRYAQFFGVISFNVERSQLTGDLVARESRGFRQFCIASRMLCIVVYAYTMWHCRNSYDDFLNLLALMRGCTTCICGICVIALQLWWSKWQIELLNRFLQLYQRLRRLHPAVRLGRGFGTQREFVLLLFKVSCWAYELSCGIPKMLGVLDRPMMIVRIACDIYTTVSAYMLMHICFVGYLSVGAFYAQINCYVRQGLRRQLRSLDMPVTTVEKKTWGGLQPLLCSNDKRHNNVFIINNKVQCSTSSSLSTSSRRYRTKAIARHVNECIGIYDEIQCVGGDFHYLLELPLCLTVCFCFSVIAMATYYIIIYTRYQDIEHWFLVLKMFTDVVLLTLAAHGAVISSRLVRRMGIETAHISKHKHWHQNLEMFLSRLNFYEFRVCPLGLFEVSNELILFFISGLVTYLTYLAQSVMQSSK